MCCLWTIRYLCPDIYYAHVKQTKVKTSFLTMIFEITFGLCYNTGLILLILVRILIIPGISGMYLGRRGKDESIQSCYNHAVFKQNQGGKT